MQPKAPGGRLKNCEFAAGGSGGMGKGRLARTVKGRA